MQKVTIYASAEGVEPNQGSVSRYVEVKINIPYTNEEALGMTVYDQEVSRKIFDLVNEERVKEGHAAMIWDEKHCYPRSVAAAGYHIMRSITQPGYELPIIWPCMVADRTAAAVVCHIQIPMILPARSSTFGCPLQAIKQTRWMIIMHMEQSL